MKLYYSPGACSQAVHIALSESGLPFEKEKVDIKAKKTESGGDFKAINPKGYVPALELDDKQVLTEVQVLLQYVADKAPDKKLAPPAGSMPRYRLQEWLAFIATELHKQFGPFFYPGTTDEVKNQQREKIASRFDLVSEKLGSQSYLTGDFSVADAYLFVMLGWAGHIAKLDLGRWPKLQALQGRVAERPAVGKVLEAEGFKK